MRKNTFSLILIGASIRERAGIGLSEHVKVKTKKINEDIINTVDFSALDILEKQFEFNKVGNQGFHQRTV